MVMPGDNNFNVALLSQLQWMLVYVLLSVKVVEPVGAGQVTEIVVIL
jgi:hypothetical protein